MAHWGSSLNRLVRGRPAPAALWATPGYIDKAGSKPAEHDVAGHRLRAQGPFRVLRRRSPASLALGDLEAAPRVRQPPPANPRYPSPTVVSFSVPQTSIGFGAKPWTS